MDPPKTERVTVGKKKLKFTLLPNKLQLECKEGDDEILQKWYIDQKVHFKPFKAHYGHEIEYIKKYFQDPPEQNFEIGYLFVSYYP